MQRLRWSAIVLGVLVAAPLAAPRAFGAAPTATPAASPSPLMSVADADNVPADDVLSVSKISSSPLPEATAAASEAPTTAAAAESEEPAATVAPAPTAAPRTPAPTVAPTPVPTPVPTLNMSCPATYFCYPRLGIVGPIVPYTDCSGSTDVGTAIRSYTCLSDTYLMGHAYTQFGLVRQWVAGDVVFAWGKRYTVTGALTEQACSAPVFPLAPLSMQTSLTSNSCGPVLVVQAR